jgi:integrase
MGLTLRKRHTAACRKKNGLAQYQDYRRCQCPFWAIGTLRHDGFIRTSTKESKLDLADLTRRTWEDAGTTAVKRPNLELEQGAAPTTLEEAESQFESAYITAKQLKGSTARKYRTMLKYLRTFARDKGYRFVKEFGVAELQAFQVSWKMGPRAAAKRLEQVRTFFQFCVDREYISINHATKMHAPTPPVTQKEPFSDEEMDRILTTARHYPTRRSDFVGPRAYALTLLLRYSGMRISDALAFSPEKLQGNSAFLYMKKTGDPVYVWLPDFVVSALKSLALVQGKYFWTTRGTDDPENVRKSWTRQFSLIFASAGRFTSKPHIHRFRHTFACALLRKGVQVDDVATLLGHSDPRVTLRHYARWVKGRQERLDNILKDAWAPESLHVNAFIGGSNGEEATLAASSPPSTGKIASPAKLSKS